MLRTVPADPPYTVMCRSSIIPFPSRVKDLRDLMPGRLRSRIASFPST
jgi:hypothetical protein